jgi:Uncharacterized protein conserved in bacteria
MMSVSMTASMGSRSAGKQRTEIVPGTATMGLGIESAMPMEVTVGGATVMVTNVERFEKL